jgi:hypothetical protein
MCGTRWRRGLDSNSIERPLARLDPERCAEQVIEQLQARCDHFGRIVRIRPPGNLGPQLAPHALHALTLGPCPAPRRRPWAAA